MYAHHNKGWFPPSEGAGLPPNGASDEKFIDWDGQTPPASSNQPNRWSVRESMAKYAGYRFEGCALADAATYVPIKTPIFFCPADNQLVNGKFWEEDNFLKHNNPSGTDNGKMRYWWVANPYHYVDPATMATINGAPYNGNEERVAARVFWHQDVDPPVHDPSRPCKVGLDYLRRTSDKRASEVAICVDRSKQATSATVWTNWYMMHGTAGSGKNIKGWKNELFGDGHCESRRLDQMKPRWSGAQPQSW
jgi:hypothetical protein